MIYISLLIVLTAAFMYDAEWLFERHLDGKDIVNCDRDVYLRRWYIVRTHYFGLFAHKFVRSDENRALHDHPWPFIVIPIWGGYIEHSDRPNPIYDAQTEHNKRVWRTVTNSDGRIKIRRRIWPIISTRFRDTTYRHRVELINGRPSWSLFIRFEKVRNWGFWLPDGFMLSNKWWQEKCE